MAIPHKAMMAGNMMETTDGRNIGHELFFALTSSSSSPGPGTISAVSSKSLSRRRRTLRACSSELAASRSTLTRRSAESGARRMRLGGSKHTLGMGSHAPSRPLHPPAWARYINLGEEPRNSSSAALKTLQCQ